MTKQKELEVWIPVKISEKGHKLSGRTTFHRPTTYTPPEKPGGFGTFTYNPDEGYVGISFAWGLK